MGFTVQESERNSQNGKIFSCGRTALSWFASHNPARAKAINLLESTHGDPANAKIGEFHPNDVWATICGALYKTLHGEAWERRLIFNCCELGRPFGERLHPDEMAAYLRMHPRTVRRYLERMYETFEEQLKLRGLI